MSDPAPPPGIPPEAAMLRLAWETVEATARPRLARVNDPNLPRSRRARRRLTRWGRRGGER